MRWFFFYIKEVFIVQEHSPCIGKGVSWSCRKGLTLDRSIRVIDNFSCQAEIALISARACLFVLSFLCFIQFHLYIFYNILPILSVCVSVYISKLCRFVSHLDHFLLPYFAQTVQVSRSSSSSFDVKWESHLDKLPMLKVCWASQLRTGDDWLHEWVIVN